MYVGKESICMEAIDRTTHRHSNPKPYVP